MSESTFGGRVFCVSCGLGMPSGNAFCPRCGTAAQAVPSSDSGTPPLASAAEPVAAPPAASAAEPVVLPAAAPRPPAPQPFAPTPPTDHSVVQPLVPQQPVPPVEVEAGKGVAIKSLLTGLTAGVLVGALATGAWSVVTSQPRPTPKTVAVGVDDLPAEIMGRQRIDLEYRDRDPKVAETWRGLATASTPGFKAAFGGDGIKMSYGVYASSPIELTVVNGALNVPVAVPPVAVARNLAVTTWPPLAVPGSATTRCTYSPAETVPLNGQDAATVITTVLNETPANGTFTCVRRDTDRNVSVSLNGALESKDSPSVVAATLASAVDQAWTEVVS